MDLNYLRLFAEMDVLFVDKEYEKCEPILSKLIQFDTDLSDEQKKFNIHLLKKRIVVYFGLRKYELLLQDIKSLQEQNVIIDWQDDIFYLYQQALLNVAIDQVIDNFKRNLCESNELFFESVIHTLKCINTKEMLKRKANDNAKPAAKKQRC